MNTVNFFDYLSAESARRVEIRRATKRLAFRFKYGRYAAAVFARAAVIAARPGEPPEVVAARVVPPKSASATQRVTA